VNVEAASGWSSLRRRAHEARWNDRAARPFASRVVIRLVRTLVVTALAFQDRMLIKRLRSGCAPEVVRALLVQWESLRREIKRLAHDL